ncbi:chorismate mutase [Aedoeadaptatus ivorii]|uniref:Chorismate mutase n=1 Tax=Aedoeadaptatus ivorii TaxID=54006 RepID=A0A3S4YNR1_9FIRM|nr:chorismate mutase [Peptoniphilus ivorii]MDQ0508003.1 chorismate mutase [Peptoniphilus ivorii]VEJ34865.1 chorismate mutase [Peptoniphilus ivorii]
MGIEAMRTEIDAIDAEMAALLKARFRLSTRIGAEKKAKGTAVADPGREEEIIARVRALAAPYGAEAEAIWRLLFTLSRNVQK